MSNLPRNMIGQILPAAFDMSRHGAIEAGESLLEVSARIEVDYNPMFTEVGMMTEQAAPEAVGEEELFKKSLILYLSPSEEHKRSIDPEEYDRQERFRYYRKRKEELGDLFKMPKEYRDWVEEHGGEESVEKMLQAESKIYLCHNCNVNEVDNPSEWCDPCVQNFGPQNLDEPLDSFFVDAPYFVTSSASPFDDFAEVEIAHDKGYDIKYTIDGGAEQDYTGTITLDVTSEITAWAVNYGLRSTFVTETFTIQCSDPTLALNADGETLEISHEDPEVSLYYSTDGETFTETNGTEPVSEAGTYYARAERPGCDDSDDASITLSKCANPTIGNVTGNLPQPIFTATISTETTGCDIYWEAYDTGYHNFSCEGLEASGSGTSSSASVSIDEDDVIFPESTWGCEFSIEAYATKDGLIKSDAVTFGPYGLGYY